MGFQGLDCQEAGDEHAVIDRILSGETELFALLVVRHQEKIFSVVVRSVRDESTARDICQDVFLKAYLNLRGFRFESSFSTWIMRIAINCVHSHFSSRTYREHSRTEALDLEQQQLTSIADDKTDCFDETAVARLHQIIPKLKPKLREVFVLCGLEQKSYEQAAVILNVPVGTVRSRLHHARLKARELYFKVKP